ncbi:MAG: hypothetical protein HYV63_07505 [Candidatus Schekmanbacteria bacterium]|nr:hypothetical protein [Candidatus Schekmanbacteria bacterium]
MRTRAWVTAFLRRRGLSAPTGDPLYRYRCGEEELAQLGVALRDDSAEVEIGGDEAWQAGFCLLGAEWWRRNHDGGPWTWRPILLEGGLGATAPFSVIHRAVLGGLRWWRRPLLTIRDNRAFLVTLACEGGLPLRLVTAQHTHLRRYFHALLEEIRLFGDASSPAALAAACAGLLPRSLRHPVVFELCGTLVATIWSYRRSLATTARDPIDVLDATTPGWKDTLPLNLSTEVASGLLRGLVDDAVAEAQGVGRRLRVLTALRRGPGGYTIERRIDLPGRVPPAAVATWLDRPGDLLPSHFEVHAAVGGGRARLLAFATRTFQEDDAGSYLLELVAPGVDRLGGEQAMAAIELHATGAARELWDLDVAGAGSLLDSPLVFANAGAEESGERQEWRLLRAGAGRFRASSVLLVPPLGAQWAAEPPAGTARLIGQLLSGFPRDVVEVGGVVRITDALGGEWRIETGADGDDADEHAVRGHYLGGLPGTRVYLGMPGVEHRSGAGARSLVPESELFWRRCSPLPHLQGGQRGGDRVATGDWQALDANQVGEGILAHRPDGDRTRFQERIRVLPAGSTLRLEPGRSPAPGTATGVARLAGTGAVTVASATDNADGDSAGFSAHCSRDPSTGAWTIDLQATDPIPESVPIFLRWQDGASMLLDLPFPRRGAWFGDREGATLTVSRPVQVLCLNGVTAEAALAPGAKPPLLGGHVKSYDAPSGELIAGDWTLREPLQQIAPGRFALDLGRVQARARLLLAMSEDIDAALELTVEHPELPAFPAVRLHVCRYDGVLRPHGELVRLEQASSWESATRPFPLSPEQRAAIRVEAFAVTAPEARVELAAAGEGWVLPRLAAGSGDWLVQAWEGDLARFRPLRLSVSTDPAAPFGPADRPATLAAAAAIARSAVRRPAFDELMASLAMAPDHPEWEHLERYLQTLDGLPATTFDAIKRLAHCPAAAAMALVRSGDPDAFARLWSGLEELPFSWSVVPAPTWLSACRLYRDSLLATMTEAGIEPSLAESLASDSLRAFVARASARRPGMAIVAELVQQRLLRERPENGMLALASSLGGAPCLLSVLESERQRLLRAHADDDWPSWPGIARLRQRLTASAPPGFRGLLVDHQVPHREAVIWAPQLAALACAWGGVALGAAELFQIRQTRDFDPGWFDLAHGVMVALALAAVEAEPSRS